MQPASSAAEDRLISFVNLGKIFFFISRLVGFDITLFCSHPRFIHGLRQQRPRYTLGRENASGFPPGTQRHRAYVDFRNRKTLSFGLHPS
ncbi:hypothetical protein SXCC_03373 [Gluconacetobacter sp. SXCC-1]|nr:hypothetical protein SXCC_03373 [Gluconacetobacter sp. SXCC-1]